MSENETENDLSTDSYDFKLPNELIAQHPLPNREDARLMQIERDLGVIQHYHVRDLQSLLSPSDCLVLNNTKVIPAALVGVRAKTGGRWQGLFLDADENGCWHVLAKTRGRIQPGEKVTLQDRNGVDRWQLSLVTKLEDGSWVVRPEKEGSVSELLNEIGRIPLPHYIRDGRMVDSDLKDYQTVYAKQEGAIAAPTAGLHFTKSLVSQLIDAGINIAQVTLHVGIGTFRPVTVENLNDHEMHFETGSIKQESVDLINSSRAAGGRIIAVGTTSVRVLETAADETGLKTWEGKTNLFVKPGYQFKVIDGLITNFHLPRSTLLVLVRTFGGNELMIKAYEEAVEESYRFFSYGDAMLIL